MTNTVKIMNWKSYEDLVRYIYAHLGKLDGVEILCSGANCRVTGKSSVDHQIDVLTSHSAGPHSYRTAIECKYWKDKVHKDVVAKLSEILEDAQIEKGVVVSKSGFTQDAVKFAEYKGISLVELREPTDDDWKGRIRNITVHIEAHIPNVCGYELIPDISSTIGSRELYQIDALTSDILIHIPNGKTESIHEIVNSEISRRKNSKEEEELHYVEFPKGSMLSVPQNTDRIPIKAIQFRSTITIVTEVIEILGKDYVAMIMSCIFENRRYVISQDGNIRQSDFSTDR